MMKSWQRQKFGMTFSQCDGGWNCADLHSHALHSFYFVSCAVCARYQVIIVQCRLKKIT